MDQGKLIEFLNANPISGEFRPYCYFSKDADSLTVYFKDNADYSKRLTDHVTLFLSVDGDDIVGCRIKGIDGILKDLPNYIHINHDDVNLSLLFLAFRGAASDQETREALNRLGQEASEKDLKLQPA